jgi:hypothetical protein
MPIDYRRYHPQWKKISRQIRDQAENKCEQCGVANGAVGARDKFGRFHSESDIEGMNASFGDEIFDGEYPKMVRIVLTVAHMADRDPMNIDPSNLQALCQRCHLNHDRPVNQAKMAETRRRRREEAIASTGQTLLREMT